ncbi:hypothetical protein Dimus_024490, partial [Dionaea muscipula]
MRLVFDEAEDPGLRMKIEEENSEPRSENLEREVRIWREKRKTRTLLIVVVAGVWWRWRNSFVSGGGDGGTASPGLNNNYIITPAQLQLLGFHLGSASSSLFFVVAGGLVGSGSN